MSFYPDIKDGLSPSALAQWFNSQGAFVKSYFALERGPETKAMQTGTELHALIEAGIVAARHVYDSNEKDVSVEIAPGRIFRGRPDSFETLPMNNTACFVDYKSGKSNEWKEKLPTDLKMRATAWLIWKHVGEPEKVLGHIEYFQTIWDSDRKRVVVIDDIQSDVISILYTAEEMRAFTQVILKAMDDINEFYEKWKESTGDFVNKNDVVRYVDLKVEIEQKEVELEEIAERILSQMEFGGEENHKTEFGSFFVRETSTYEYPPYLPVHYTDMELTLDSADGINAAAKAAKTNYELTNDPKTTKRKVQFRFAKEKK